MQLIWNWRKSWRMFSQQAFILAGSLQGSWLALSPDLKENIPAVWVTYLTIAILVAGFIGRLIDQPKVTQ